VKKSILIVIVILIGAALLGTGYALWNMIGAKGAIVVSGVIEADDIHVGSKIGVFRGWGKLANASRGAPESV